MKVRVRLFARAKDLVGAESVSLELPEGARVNDLRRRLTVDHPTLATLLERSAIAVDNEFADNDVVLSPCAEIALLPPVSGG
jgi:molybdopterin converting factor subunit 1